MKSLFILLYEELLEHLDERLKGLPLYESKYDISRLTVQETADLNEMFYQSLAKQYDSSVTLKFNVSFHITSNEIEVDENRIESLVPVYTSGDQY